jgi:hypothetical protein
MSFTVHQRGRGDGGLGFRRALTYISRMLSMRRKFRIGQSVNYRPAVRGQNAQPLGKCQVTRFLPQRKDGEPEYQIRHLNEGHEWVARESELRSA